MDYYNIVRIAKLTLMGSSQSPPALPSSNNYTILDYGYCRVWKRRDNQREAMQEYDILIQNQKLLQAYRQMWLVRTQQPSIVAVFYFTHKNQKNFCAVYDSGTLLTERIPYRLSQFSHIPYSEVIAIIRKALEGYELLSNQYGLFKVRSTMIGVCGQGEIKVWHHTDYSQALPENANCSTLNQMILSIIAAVERNAQSPHSHPKFSEFVVRNKPKGNSHFNSILDLLNKYSERYQMPFRESLPSLGSYLRQVEGWEEYSYNSNFRSNLSRLANTGDNQKKGEHQMRGTDRGITRKPSVDNHYNSGRSRSQKNGEKIRIDSYVRGREKNSRGEGRNGSVIDHLKDSDSEDTVKNGRPSSIYTAQQINDLLGKEYAQKAQEALQGVSNRGSTQLQSRQVSSPNNPFPHSLRSNHLNPNSREREISQSSKRSSSSSSKIQFRYCSPSRKQISSPQNQPQSIRQPISPDKVCIYTSPSYFGQTENNPVKQMHISLKSLSETSNGQLKPERLDKVKSNLSLE